MNSNNECFICYTEDGKSNQEELYDIYFHKTHKYPFISLSYAYGCNCNTTFAHNICLKKILRCPTCRKSVNKPNLHVNMSIEKYISLNFIHNDPKNLDMFIVLILMFFFIILSLIYLSENDYFYISSTTRIFMMFFMVLLLNYSYYFSDYIKKYWLYDHNLKKFY